MSLDKSQVDEIKRRALKEALKVAILLSIMVVTVGISIYSDYAAFTICQELSTKTPLIVMTGGLSILGTFGFSSALGLAFLFYTVEDRTRTETLFALGYLLLALVDAGFGIWYLLTIYSSHIVLGTPSTSIAKVLPLFNLNKTLFYATVANYTNTTVDEVEKITKLVNVSGCTRPYLSTMFVRAWTVSENCIIQKLVKTILRLKPINDRCLTQANTLKDYLQCINKTRLAAIRHRKMIEEISSLVKHAIQNETK